MPKTLNTPSPAAADAELTYEAALSELDALIARMESGQLPLDNLLSGYERGAALLQICRSKLAAIEQQIRRIDEKLAPLGEGA